MRHLRLFSTPIFGESFAMKLWRYIACWALLVILFFMGLWFSVHKLKGEISEKESLAMLHSHREAIESMISHRWEGLENLASQPIVADVLGGNRRQDLARFFDFVAGLEEMSLVFLLDSEGVVVDVSTQDGHRTMVGDTHRSQPYFKYAMSGRRMVSHGVAEGTKKRGLYMASPVWNQGEDPVGVLVFKFAMSSVDELFRHEPMPVVLLDGAGVVFSGNTRHWLHHTARQGEAKGGQRPTGSQEMTESTVLPWGLEDEEAVVEDVIYRIVEVFMPAYKWTLVGLIAGDLYPPLPMALRRIFQGAALFGLFFITLVMGLWTAVSRRFHAERILTKHRETLEDVVNRRTRQLEKVNDTLVRELEQKRFTEKRLQDNDRLFKRANRIAGLGSWEWYLAEDRVILSDVMMAIYDSQSTGHEGHFEEMIYHMVHPDDRESVVNAGHTMLETGAVDALEYRIVRGDGEVRWVRAESPEVKEFDRSGEPVSLIGTVQDITERKLSENSLLRLKAAMEQSVDGIAISDLEGVVEFVNPSWAEMHGYRAVELVGVKLDSFHTREQEEGQVRTFLKKVVAYGSCEGEIGHVSRNGRTFPTWMSSSLMAGEGKTPVGIVSICRDISTQKRAEALLKRAKDEAEAATRAKSAFLANMSHEIRTPMNGVIGMIDILLDTGLSHEQRDYAESVKSSADALLILINDILDFSKIEAGKLDIEVIEFNLRTVLEDLSDVMAIRAKEKGLEFASLIHDNVPIYLKGDPVRLRQILTNLAGNAVKFVEKGSVMIRVALKEELQGSVRLFFEVVDTGIGIGEEALSTIFDSFSQGDASTTRKYGGTGLGLAISKQLTRLMSGNIGGESRLGEGTTFWFTADFEKQPGVKDEWSCSADALKNCHLMIVDDNSVNRQVFREYARSWKCRTVEVATGLEALSVAERLHREGNSLDAAIIDMQMPGMDGEELGRRFKGQATTRDIPLLMATSIGQRGDAVRMKEIGFVAFVTKPVRKKELCERLLQMLNCGGRCTSDDPTEPVANLALKKEPGISPIHVLLAEDNRMNQRVAVNMLEKLGHSVRVANNGVEAVAAFTEEAFDVILMDGQMPEMDGMEATLEIRRLEKEGLGFAREVPSHVPIIAVTANAMKGDRERFISSGMDEYIAKPIKKADLETVISRVLNAMSEP